MLRNLSGSWILDMTIRMNIKEDQHTHIVDTWGQLWMNLDEIGLELMQMDKNERKDGKLVSFGLWRF